MKIQIIGPVNNKVILQKLNLKKLILKKINMKKINKVNNNVYVVTVKMNQICVLLTASSFV